jgi:hypothetical protein
MLLNLSIVERSGIRYAGIVVPAIVDEVLWAENSRAFLDYAACWPNARRIDEPKNQLEEARDASLRRTKVKLFLGRQSMVDLNCPPV